MAVLTLSHNPMYVVPGASGLLVRGTIDVHARPVVLLKNGSVATVRSASFTVSTHDSGKVAIPAAVKSKHKTIELLVPTVVGNRIVSPLVAIKHALGTGLHLGGFDNVRDANSYAVKLHNEQARYYREQIKKKQGK